MDCSPPGSSVHGILQARIQEWPFPSPGNLPNPGIEPDTLASPALAGRFFTTSTTGKPQFIPLLPGNWLFSRGKCLRWTVKDGNCWTSAGQAFFPHCSRSGLCHGRCCLSLSTGPGGLLCPHPGTGWTPLTKQRRPVIWQSQIKPQDHQPVL